MSSRSAPAWLRCTSRRPVRPGDAVGSPGGLLGRSSRRRPLHLGPDRGRCSCHDHVPSRTRFLPTVTIRKPPSGCGRTPGDGRAADVVERLGGGGLLDLPALTDGDDAEEPLVPALGSASRSCISRGTALEDLQGSTTPETGASGVGTMGSACPSRSLRAAAGRPVPAVAAPRPAGSPWRFAVTTPQVPSARPNRTCVDPCCRGPRARRAAPRAGTDIDSVLATVGPLCEDVCIRGAQAVREMTARLDGVDSEDFVVPAGGAGPRAAECDPALRAALEEMINRVRRVHADERRGRGHHGRRAARLPSARCGSAASGCTCRAGWRRCFVSVVMNVVPAQIAGRRVDRRRLPAAARPRGPARPGCPRRLALLGVTEVYAVGGAQAIAVFGYGAAPAARRHGHRTGQRLRDGGQAAAARPDRDRLRGRSDRGRDPRRRHGRPGARSGRPDRQAEHDPLAGAVLVTTSEQLADAVLDLVPAQVAATKHSDRIATALTAASPASSSSTTSTPACGSSTRTPPSTWRSRPGTRTRSRCASATRGRSSSGPGRRSPWATTARAPTTCCPPAGAPGTPAACRCSRSSAASTLSSRPAGAGRRRRPHRRPVRARRTCRPTPRPCGSGSAEGSLDELPLRPELRGRTPYGAPQLPASTG